MQSIDFYKYQGTGNDFILIDNRSEIFPKKNKKLIQKLCDRHFGIGSDGLILIENHNQADFSMTFFNPDASESMCGNGARCAVAFAHKLKIINNHTEFNAFDGLHKAEIQDDIISLEMKPLTISSDNVFELNTGTLHQIKMVENIEHINVKEQGAKIRYAHSLQGINVNFVENIDNYNFKVRTYERGVENETLSCGTGATAVAIAMYHNGYTNSTPIILHTLGGLLKVDFLCNRQQNTTFYNKVMLIGQAQFIYKGTYNAILTQ